MQKKLQIKRDTKATMGAQRVHNSHALSAIEAKSTIEVKYMDMGALIGCIELMYDNFKMQARTSWINDFRWPRAPCCHSPSSIRSVLDSKFLQRKEKSNLGHEDNAGKFELEDTVAGN